MFQSAAVYSVAFGAVPKATCSCAREFLTRYELSPGELTTPTGTVAPGGDLRRARVCFIEQDNWLSDLLLHFMRAANESRWQFDAATFSSVQYSEYEADCWFEWHRDAGFCRPVNASRGADSPIRKLTGILVLSETSEYSGGNLEIRDDAGVVYRDARFRCAGTVIVFPSFLFHRVRRIETGMRRSLTGWLLGPPFR